MWMTKTSDLKTLFVCDKINCLNNFLMKGIIAMTRRILCALCALFLLFSMLPAAAEGGTDGSHSYDFDLSFSMNANAFPKLSRSRMSGYAALVNCLGLKGNIAWSDETRGMDLDAVLYFRDNPSLSYPFRLYGTKERLFLSSPLLKEEVIFFNMAATLEFAVKAKNTLGLPLPYFAFLSPYVWEWSFASMAAHWEEAIGNYTESGTVTLDQFRALADLWNEDLEYNEHVQRWINALAEGADTRQAAEAINKSFYENLIYYYEPVTMNQPLTVTVGDGSVTWENVLGKILFSRVETADSLSVLLDLPATENGYVPAFSLVSNDNGSTYNFELRADLCKEGFEIPVDGVIEKAKPSEAGLPDEVMEEEVTEPEEEEEEIIEEVYEEYEDDYNYDYEDEEFDSYVEEEDFDDVASLPDLLLHVYAKGENLPKELPADSSFDLTGTTFGEAYPDYSFCLHGETKKDGYLLLSLRKPKPAGDPAEPEEIFSCSGTMIPAEPREIPDYMQLPLDTYYNVFSFNETRLAEFRNKVVPLVLRSVLTFVSEMPTSACQSFLDDLTDSGVLNMLLD